MIALVKTITKEEMINIMKRWLYLQLMHHTNPRQCGNTWEIEGFDVAAEKIMQALDDNANKPSEVTSIDIELLQDLYKGETND